jgi:hypothetical protein
MPTDTPLDRAPVIALIEMLEAADIQEDTTIFDHTPEEIGLHVMENHREILAALASPPSSDAKMTRLIMTPHAGVHYVEEAGIAAPSYITNCYLKRRDGDDSPYLFRDDQDGNIIVHLDGYAIVPADEYHDLSTNPSPSARISADDKDRENPVEGVGTDAVALREALERIATAKVAFDANPVGVIATLQEAVAWMYHREGKHLGVRLERAKNLAPKWTEIPLYRRNADDK